LEGVDAFLVVLIQPPFWDELLSIFTPQSLASVDSECVETDVSLSEEGFRKQSLLCVA